MSAQAPIGLRIDYLAKRRAAVLAALALGDVPQAAARAHFDRALQRRERAGWIVAAPPQLRERRNIRAVSQFGQYPARRARARIARMNIAHSIGAWE